MMLKEKLQSDSKTALLGRDSEKLEIIRFILSEVKNKEIEKRAELTDEEVLSVISTLQKRSLDSVSQYSAGNRQDLVDSEQKYLEVYKSYLPEALTEDQIRTLVMEAIDSLSAATISDMGKVMGYLAPLTKNKADGSLVSSIVRESLENG
ncbi:hypothetical protein A3A70_02390 [candidate division WWE3 bacterium RIFCSPLOWO2_01_FULL_42_11]|uniref:Glutamyl-tRNA amidotransferase n=1 Tax=candidate division WWE3 bacterium RIFCSPLOWO2_01_FULL_42_11 TaxID=1802627 RepID=A0A1F4VRZ8_UNCKA|nr:MAG: hypothetical protein A3A70_02390 [candidate division WWE3 bacterium RIFCSPLOWO2_01_FULL_42_11]